MAYIQVIDNLFSNEKREKETASLLKIDDNFEKIIITKDGVTPLYDKNCLKIIGLYNFLLDESLFY